MDTPPSNRKRRDPEAHKRKQKLYRQRQYAKVNGIENVKSLHRRRYHERMARMKATGEYKDFAAKKAQQSLKRYHNISEEKRVDIRRRNAQSQKNWMQRMKEEGTYEAYKQRLNARRRALQAERKQAMGPELWKALQSRKYERRQQQLHWRWLDEHLARPFPLPWLPLDWAESEPEEDTVQTVRAKALQQMDHYL